LHADSDEKKGRGEPGEKLFGAKLKRSEPLWHQVNSARGGEKKKEKKESQEEIMSEGGGRGEGHADVRKRRGRKSLHR